MGEMPWIMATSLAPSPTAAVTGFFGIFFIMATISAFCNGDILQQITDSQLSANCLSNGTVSVLFKAWKTEPRVVPSTSKQRGSVWFCSKRCLISLSMMAILEWPKSFWSMVKKKYFLKKTFHFTCYVNFFHVRPQVTARLTDVHRSLFF